MTVWTLAQAGTTVANGGGDAYFIWGCVLFAIAVALLILELLVPSGGLIGILCGVAGVASIVAFMKYDTTWGLGVALGYIVLTPIIIVFTFKLWLNSPLSRAMILGAEEPCDEDPNVTSERERLERLEELKALIGADGVTETALRPVGTVRINGERVDGLAESGIIPPNTPVTVTDVYDNQIKVRPRTD